MDERMDGWMYGWTALQKKKENKTEILIGL